MKFFKFIYVLMLCILSWPAYGDGRRDDVVFHTLQVKDGLPQISVLDIVQDQVGYMWFATRDGVARWDGYGFDVYKSEDHQAGSLCCNYVTTLLSSSDGSVWMGTLYGLSRYDPVSDRFRNYYAGESGLSDDRVRRLYMDSSGNIWCCTNNGICRYDEEADRFDSFISERCIDCMVETKDKNVMMLGSRDGLMLFDCLSGSVKELDVHGLELNVRSLFKDCRGNIWVGTANSGALMLDPRFNLIRHFTAEGHKMPVNNNFIRAIKEDQTGRILIGSFDGLNVYDPSSETMVSYRQNEGLSSFSLHSIYCDRSNVVWLGSYVGGINYYTTSEKPFLRFERPHCDGKPLTGIVGPMVRDKSGIWIGMEGGGLLFYDEQKDVYRQYALPVSSRDFRSNIINSLYMRGQTLWVGLNNGCIVEFDTVAGKMTRMQELPGNLPVVALYVDTDHTIYVGTFGEQSGLIVISPDKEIIDSFTDDSGRSCQFRNITSIVEDADGFILLASNVDGIHRYNLYTRQYSFHKLETSGLRYPEMAINQLYRAVDGSLWAATLNNGLLYLDSNLNVLSSFTRNEGLLSNTVCSVAEAADNTIWCSTYSAITSIDPSGEGNVRTWHIPSECNEFSTRSVVRSGENLYFGSDCGVISLDVTAALKQVDAIPPVIKKVTANDDFSSMSFEFRSLDYIETSQIRYSYMLEGISDTWSRPDANNNVNYANIPPGRYSFRVKAFKSPDDVVGVEGESFSFRVRPPVWRRWWAIAAYFVFSAFCMFMIYEVRNKRLQLERVEKDHKETIRKILNSQLAFPDEKERSSPDERFLKKLYEVMRNNLSSSGLNTEYLCSEIGVSRTNLYYKLKSLTGLSPTEFIRNHRVQLAARLMVEKRVPVSEVYEMVGFNSHPYFCSCFKKVMGCSPTEYIRRNKN